MDKSKPGVELLSDLADRITSKLIEHGLADGQAHGIGEAISLEIAAAWGGLLLYIPKGKFLLLAKRDREIWDAFDGRNVKDLARQFQVTEQHIYRIIKSMRMANMDSRHGDLFEQSATDDDDVT